MRNLPHQAFEKFPIVQGSVFERTGGGGETISIVSVSFAIRMAGTVNTAFPQAIRVATQPFQVAVGLVSVSLSTSMVNTSTDACIGAVVAKDVGSTLSFGTSSDVYVEHLCEAGLGNAYRSGVGFADDICPKIGTNESVALYLTSSGSGYATNLISAIVTLKFFQNYN